MLTDQTHLEKKIINKKYSGFTDSKIIEINSPAHDEFCAFLIKNN